MSNEDTQVIAPPEPTYLLSYSNFSEKVKVVGDVSALMIEPNALRIFNSERFKTRALVSSTWFDVGWDTYAAHRLVTLREVERWPKEERAKLDMVTYMSSNLPSEHAEEAKDMAEARAHTKRWALNAFGTLDKETQQRVLRTADLTSVHDSIDPISVDRLVRALETHAKAA